MNEVKDTGPLDWRIAITDKTGRPTPEFQRRWNEQRSNNNLIGFITIGSGDPSGTPNDGDAYIDSSVTPYIFWVGNGGTWHHVGVVLDDISTTQGAIIFRNATEWVALAPGSAGQVLQTNGAGADPAWGTVVGSGLTHPQVMTRTSLGF